MGIHPLLIASALALVIFNFPATSQSLDFSPTELPWAIVDEEYTPPPLVVKGGTRCYAGEASFVAVDELPPGLTLSGFGQLGGAPRKTGSYHFQVRVADACSAKVRDLALFVTGAPMLAASVASVEFRYRRGGPNPEPKGFLVQATWPDLAYDLNTHEVPWLKATPAKGRIPRPGTAVNGDRVTISVVPESLAPGSYEAKLTISTRRGATAPVIKVLLTVE